ncbi:MAG: heparan-alpha-glucosaminide N-acetyltransferase domain-containing protein [Cyclobacteriaceae bacterium]
MTTELASPLAQKQRIASIDLVRGIVMIIMALDHTRDFFHVDANLFNPTDLTKTTTLLFFTRWATHFCAPTFVFLSGLSAGLSLQRKSKKELSWFLFTRGLWLVIVELTIMRFGFTFNFYYDITFFEVIFTIGASMIVLSALVFLPQQAILGIGLLLIFGHDAISAIRFTPEDSGFIIWTLAIQPGFIALDASHGIFVSYPVIPWLGIMLAGFGAARLYTHFSPDKRKRVLRIAGVAAIALFIIIRFTNVLAPLDAWSVQDNAWFTFLSFINCTKYPVTLLFTLMILGPIMILLSFTEGARGWFTAKATVFGRVPLFYFIVHFYVLHIAALVTHLIVSGKSLSDIDFHVSAGLGGIGPGTGYPLVWTYVAWITVVTGLYPLCNWYNRFKSTHAYKWLSYL